VANVTTVGYIIVTLNS